MKKDFIQYERPLIQADVTFFFEPCDIGTLRTNEDMAKALAELLVNPRPHPSLGDKRAVYKTKPVIIGETAEVKTIKVLANK